MLEVQKHSVIPRSCSLALLVVLLRMALLGYHLLSVCWEIYDSLTLIQNCKHF